MTHLPRDINIDTILETALEAGKRASNTLLELSDRSKLEISYKGSGKNNLVTEYDLRSEKVLIELIRSRFPEHLILSEETVKEIRIASDYKKPLWIIDPIDGTTNFAYGLHAVSISIAFAYDGLIYAGVVHAPFLNEVFSAKRGGGAYKNGERIHASGAVELKDSLIATGYPYDKSNLEPIIGRTRAVLANCRDIRRIGSAALDACWVASGQLDGYYETINLWDIAAASLIAREAGCEVGYLSEKTDPDLPDEFRSRDFVVANSVLLPKLISLLQSA